MFQVYWLVLGIIFTSVGLWQIYAEKSKREQIVKYNEIGVVPFPGHYASENVFVSMYFFGIVLIIAHIFYASFGFSFLGSFLVQTPIFLLLSKLDLGEYNGNSNQVTNQIFYKK